MPEEDWEGFTVQGSELMPKSDKTLFTWTTWKRVSRQEGNTRRGVGAQEYVACGEKSKAEE